MASQTMLAGMKFSINGTQNSHVSKRLKTIAKIFAAAGTALTFSYNISIFPNDFPYS